jgi:glycosyltransferase involved in cell wall biosynthesis
MVGNLVASEDLRRKYDVGFSYRYTPEYDRGFRARVSTIVETFPLALLDTETLTRLTETMPKWVDRAWKLLLFVLQVRYVFLAWNTITLWRFLRRQGVDILHVNNGGYPAAYSCNAAVVAARLLGIRRIVYVVNNIAQSYRSPLRWTDYPIDRIVAAGVTMFVTGSKPAAAAVRKVLRIPAGRVRTIHNGVARRSLHECREALLERLGVPDGRPLLAMVAVVERRKGHAVIVEAMRILRDQLGPSEMPILLIEGVGSKAGELRAAIREHALEDCVRYVGAEKHVFDLLSAVDVVVLPSISHEDFPNVTLEAMSLGKPVIASRLAGLPEQIVEMESGILVTPGDPTELADAVRRLVGSSDLRERLGRGALARFNEHFRHDIAVSAYISLYDQLCAGAS